MRHRKKTRTAHLHRLKAPCSVLLTLAIIVVPLPAPAYSVLTHEELIDLAWDDSIRPLLQSRYPGISHAALAEAHAYAYGGSAIQDMGYYPFGKQFFSNLTHYVRTGDFVASLFRNAHNANELAFAVGALSHYLGDNTGHSECINVATPVEFPRLEHKYGNIVTYDESPHGHVRTEFAFDIDQLSHHRLAPAAYLRHVGFKVPRALVERSFYETYGLPLEQVLGPVVPAMRSYRWSVRSFIPRFAWAEALLHHNHMPPDVNDAAFQTFAQDVQNADFQRHWAASRKSAGFVTHVLAVVIVIIPKIGVISDLAIRGPDVQTEQQYVHSVNDTMAQFRDILHRMREQPSEPIVLANRDLDTGNLVRPGAYRLTDETYAVLLQKITAEPGREVPFGIRRDLLAFYSDPNAPIITKNNQKAWTRVQEDLATLRQMPLRQAEQPGLVATDH
jgi:Zinc dependent phospholipase C